MLLLTNCSTIQSVWNISPLLWVKLIEFATLTYQKMILD